MTRAKAKKDDSTHYFIDGWVSWSGWLGVVAYPNSLKGTDAEFTTFYTYSPDGEWGHERFDFDSRSILARKERSRGAWWVLGKRGEVVEFAGTPRQEQIADAGTGRGRYGYLNKLALIDTDLYACGYARQVYRRTGSTWQHVDRGTIADADADGIGFESIDGRSQSDIYAVGLGGEMWHYDGRLWRQIDSPTNEHLFEVACVNPKLTYAVGKAGVVVRGDGNRWEVLRNKEFDEDLWGVAHFNGTTYVAGYGGIARIEGAEVVPVDTGLGKPVAGYRLRTGPGVLWSIGNHHLLRFDGTAWTEIVCPDNA